MIIQALAVFQTIALMPHCDSVLSLRVNLTQLICDYTSLLVPAAKRGTSLGLPRLGIHPLFGDEPAPTPKDGWARAVEHLSVTSGAS